MLAEPIPFPKTVPPGFELLKNEPKYDARRHLALEKPTRVLSLKEIGYDDETIASCASPVAMTSPFRLLSDEGVTTLRDIALALRKYRFRERSQGAYRANNNIKSAVYRSQFIRSLCGCPIVVAFLSDIARTPLAPHSMPSVQAGINYTPDDLSQAVDTWHVDSIGFDYVMMVSDPSTLEGGKFQYFLGTKTEAGQLLHCSPQGLTAGFIQDLPMDRVETIAFPAAGYAFFMQGNMILHRATRLLKLQERITFIPGYVSRDVAYADPTNSAYMRSWSDRGILTELARHGAWLSRAKLDTAIRDLSFTDDRVALVAALRSSIADVERIVADLETRPGPSD